LRPTDDDNHAAPFARRCARAALLLSVLLCGPAAADSSATTPAASSGATYVGATVCATCHAQEAARWRDSHHARAMQSATADTVLGHFSGATLSDGKIDARFAQQGARFVVHTDGPDGKPADFDVAYTFGVDPLQQYLLRLADGRLQSFTVAWDARPALVGGQRWMNLYPNEALPPGDPLHWTGAEQNWNYQCAACHSTNLRKQYDAAHDRYDTTWSDLNVACEACHGPGSQHVGWAAHATPRSDASQPDGLLVHFPSSQLSRWKTDPATGSPLPGSEPAPAAELDSCAPCHMRRRVIAPEPAPITAPLLDTYVPSLLVEDRYFADGQIEGEVYEYGSFVQSKMYRAGVSCRNCHEPHTLALRAPGNAVCAQCHAPATFDTPAHHFHSTGSPGARCANCHMPTTTYMLVDERRDHSLRIPRPDLSVTIGTPNACNHCHADRDAVWAREQMRRWYGHDPSGYQHYAEALHAGRDGAPDAAAKLAALIRDGAQPPIARATALTLLAAPLDGASTAALQSSLGDRDALIRWAAAGALAELPPAQRLPLAAPLLADPIRAVRIEAARQLAGVPVAAAGALGAPIAQGIDELVAAELVNAERPETHTNLCALYAQRGDGAAAEDACRTAIRLQPTYTPAYVNLADLYRAEQRDADGEKTLRSGLTVVPGSAELHYALGLALVRQQRSADGVAELRRGAALAPDNARYAYVLGIALHSTGDTDEALDVLQKAQTRHPRDRDVLIALITINRDAGHLAAARDYAERLAAVAPDDPSARQLLQQISAMSAATSR